MNEIELEMRLIKIENRLRKIEEDLGYFKYRVRRLDSNFDIHKQNWLE